MVMDEEEFYKTIAQAHIDEIPNYYTLLDEMESDAVKMANGGSAQKRYVAETDYYIFANSDNEAEDKAREVANEIDKKYDNGSNLKHLTEKGFGSTHSRKIFEEGGETSDLGEKIKQYDKFQFEGKRTSQHKGYRVREIFSHFLKEGYSLDQINSALGIIKYSDGGTLFGDVETKKFNDLGLKVLDWQMNDPSVGIREGYVVFEDDNGTARIISWNDAVYFNTKEEIMSHSKIEDEYAKGGKVKGGYMVFNYTDNIYASPEVYRTQKEAKEFIKSFRKRFEKQGYYKTNRLERLNPEHIDLEVIPEDFSPFRKMENGGSTDNGNSIKELDRLVGKGHKEEAIEHWNYVMSDSDKEAVAYSTPNTIDYLFPDEDEFSKGGATKLMAGRERLYEDDKVMLEHNKVSDHYDLRDSQTGMFMEDGGEVDSITLKLIEILNKYNPPKLQWDRGTLWVNAGNGLQKSAITSKFNGYGDAITIGNIVWRGVRSEGAKENIERLTDGNYTVKHDFNKEPYVAKSDYYEDGGMVDSYADGGIIEGELEEAITKLKAVAKKQQFMKDVNSILRSKDDVENKLRALGLSEESIIKAQEPDRYGKFGFPSYALTNNNANLKRLEKRVDMLKDKMGGLMDAELGNEEAYEFDGGEIKVNYPIDRVQILFPNGRTDKETYRLLRKNGWVYSRTNQAFQRKITPQAIRNGVNLFNATKVTPNKEKTMDSEQQKEVVIEETPELVWFTPQALKVVPKHQRGIIKGALEEFQDAIIRINKAVEEMPKTYQTDGVKDKMVYLHYFYGNADWYIVEKDMSASVDGHLQDFGYANIGHGAELGYISIKELVGMGNVELDLYFEPRLWSELQEQDIDEDLGVSNEEDIEEDLSPSDDEYPKYNFHNDNMSIVDSKEFIFTKEINILGARLIRGGKYPNEISFKYNKNEFNLFDNGGEFKLDNKTTNEYLGAIYFTEWERKKDPKELAKEVMELVKDSIEETLTEEPIGLVREVVELNPKITRLINFLNENKIPIEKAFRWNDADIEDETMASRNHTLPKSNGTTLWQIALKYGGGNIDVANSGRESRVTWDGGDLLEAIKEFYATKNMEVKLTIEEPIEEATPTAIFKGTEITAYENPYELNRAIESMIDEKGDVRENYNADEIEFMGYYSGYGGLEKFGAKGKGLLYEYFTPTEICEKMMALAYEYGYGTIGDNSILEPSVGTGNFLKYAPANVKIDAYEINIYSKQICQILYPHAEVTLRSFEENFIKNNLSVKGKTDDIHKYSLVIGNPPYGVVGGKYMGMGEKKYTKASNYTEYFITRGLDMLVSGGILMYIVGAEQKNGGKLFLDSGDSKVKQEIFAKADLMDAYRLPTNIFERTGVSSEILVFKKR
jgi:hypothetical protein